jgi:HEAT repeat protein
MVINKINVQKLLLCLNQSEDSLVRKNAAMCIRELVHKNSNIANVIVNNKGVQVLIEYISTTKGDSLVNGVLALGLIAAYKEDYSMLIIKNNGVIELKKALETETNQSIKSIICFTLGCIGGHSASHAFEIAKEKLLSIILFYNMSYESSDELKNKSKEALKKIISVSNTVEHLEPLLQVASENILKHILFQIFKILKNSKEEMKGFMMSGGLSKVQELKGRVSEVMKLKIDEINSIYPYDVIKYFSPEYCNSLIEKIS